MCDLKSPFSGFKVAVNELASPNRNVWATLGTARGEGKFFYGRSKRAGSLPDQVGIFDPNKCRGKRRAGLTRFPQVSPTPMRNGLSFLGLPPEEWRDVQIVGGNILADFADLLLDLVNDLRQCLLGRRIRHFAAGLPRLGQE